MQMTYIGILAFCLLKYYLDNVYKLSLFHPETEATIQQLSFFFLLYVRLVYDFYKRTIFSYYNIYEAVSSTTKTKHVKN